MNFIDKKHIKKALGKVSILNQNRSFNDMEYISGIPVFDKMIENLPKGAKPQILFIERPNGYHIEMINNWSKESVGIDAKDINDIHIEDKEFLYEEKDKSVIGRAILGGLVLGPVGAIVGGMSGIGTKKKLSDFADTFITFKGDNDATVVFACSSKKKVNVLKFFRQSKFANV